MNFYGSEPEHELTYSDVFLVPSHSQITSRMDVSLASSDQTGMNIPLVSANMNSVTGPRLAATLARRGGLGVLPQDMSLEHLQTAIAWIKEQPVFYETPFTVLGSQSVADVLFQMGPFTGHGVVVKDADDKFLGWLPATRLATALRDSRMEDLLHGKMLTAQASEITNGHEAFEFLETHQSDFAPVMRGNDIVGSISKKGALRSTFYAPACDVQGRLRVAVAIGINGDVAHKTSVLAQAGADVLVLDTAHGDQESMRVAIAKVKALGLDLPIVAGNIVTASAVQGLVAEGADILKVGVGPGAMCTTRMMTAVGRPQFSAVLETSLAAAELGAHVWADGGIRYPRDVALALAAGASAVMIGSWFAGTLEAPGVFHADQEGRLYKESWGMASTKAVVNRFGSLSGFERARKELFAEGISGSKIYVDQLRPSVEDLLDMITTGLRSSFTYAGAQTLQEFHKRACVGVQSAAGYEEGKALPVSW